MRRSTVLVGNGDWVPVGTLLSYSLVKVHLFSMMAFLSGSFVSLKIQIYFDVKILCHFAHKPGSFRGA